MVSLRMGRVTERKLEPPNEEPLKLELGVFYRLRRSAERLVVSGEDGLRALGFGDAHKRCYRRTTYVTVS